MDFREFCSYLKRLEATDSRLEKTEILAELFSRTDELKETIAMSYGYLKEDIGVAEGIVAKALARAYGVPEETVKEMFRKLGDLGDVARELSLSRKQATLMRKTFSVAEIYGKLMEMAKLEGKASVERRIETLVGLLSHLEGDEARYVVRIVLSTLRIGVGDGIIRDALARAFSIPAERIEHAYNFLPDYSEIGEMIRNGRLEEIRLTPGRPVRVMLAEAGKLEEVLERIENPIAEYKYDGFRVQIHHWKEKGWKTRIFTRRLEDVTERFPEIVEWAGGIEREYVIEGEAVGYRDGFLPFQTVSRRIQRKYNIREMMERIPVKVFCFDILWLDGEEVMERPLKERRELLEGLIRDSGFLLAHYATSGFEKFYEKALEEKQEGIMVKDLKSKYIPGKRVGHWYKVKPEKETLDVVITAAEHGEGKKAGMLSSFYIAVRNEWGEFVEVGKVSSGFSDEELVEMNEMLKDLVTGERDGIVIVKPEIVIEVRYQEIQKSPHYPSGFALRFPRFVSFRPDRSPESADTVERVARLYEKQFS